MPGVRVRWIVVVALVALAALVDGCAPALSPAAQRYQEAQQAAAQHDWFTAAAKYQAAGDEQDARARAVDAQKRADTLQATLDDAQQSVSNDATLGKAYADLTTVLRDCPTSDQQPKPTGKLKDACDKANKLNAQLMPALAKLLKTGEDALQPQPGQPKKPNPLTPDMLQKAADAFRSAGAYKGSAKRADDLAALQGELDQNEGKMQAAATAQDWAGALDAAQAALKQAATDKRVSSYRYTDYKDIRATRAKFLAQAVQGANAAFGERRWQDAEAILTRVGDACRDDAANAAPDDQQTCDQASALLGQVRLAQAQPSSGEYLVDQTVIGSGNAWKGGTWMLTGADVNKDDGRLRLTVTYRNDAKLLPDPLVDAALQAAIDQANADIATKQGAVKTVEDALDAATVAKAQAEASATPATRQQSPSVVGAQRDVARATQDLHTAQGDLAKAKAHLADLQRQQDAATANQKQVALANKQADVQIGCADLGDDSLAYLKLQLQAPTPRPGSGPAAGAAAAVEQRVSAVKGSCKGSADPLTVKPGATTQFSVDFALPDLAVHPVNNLSFSLVWYGAGEAKNVSIRPR